jgi:hypothetical protein
VGKERHDFVTSIKENKHFGIKLLYFKTLMILQYSGEGQIGLSIS